MEEIWNKYKEEQLQTSAYMFRQNEKMYKQIFFDAFYLGAENIINSGIYAAKLPVSGEIYTPMEDGL